MKSLMIKIGTKYYDLKSFFFGGGNTSTDFGGLFGILGDIMLCIIFALYFKYFQENVWQWWYIDSDYFWPTVLIISGTSLVTTFANRKFWGRGIIFLVLVTLFLSYRNLQIAKAEEKEKIEEAAQSSANAAVNAQTSTIPAVQWGTTPCGLTADYACFIESNDSIDVYYPGSSKVSFVYPGKGAKVDFPPRQLTGVIQFRAHNNVNNGVVKFRIYPNTNGQ